jgi:hypothetical protein
MSNRYRRSTASTMDSVSRSASSNHAAGAAARCVWRDGLGPGFAVAASGRLIAYAASTAQGQYRCT